MMSNSPPSWWPDFCARALTSVIILAGVVLSVLGQSLVVQVLSVLLGLAAIVMAIALPSDRLSSRAIWLLALATPLLPMFGGEVLLGFAGIVLLSIPARAILGGWCIGLPFLVWIAGQTIGELWYGLRRADLEPLWQAGFLDELFRFGPHPVWYSDLLTLFRWIVLFGLLGVLRGSPDCRQAAYRGGVIGLTLMLLVALVHTVSGFPTLASDQPFWLALGRFSATFSDPNAAGIFLGLSLLLFVPSLVLQSAGRSRVALLTVCLALSVLGILTGSRSFFLALALGLGLMLPRRKLVWYLGFGAAFVASINVSPSSMLPHLPGGLARLAQTVQFETVGQALWSRSVFWQMALWIGEQAAPWGVGLNRFVYSIAPATMALGVDLGGWTDNANNFYLGLFAEGGVVAVLALIVTMYLCRFRDLSSSAGCAAIVLALLLLVGPHLDFVEVSLLAALILSHLVVGHSPALSRATLISSALIGLVSLWATPYHQRGFYNWERDGSRLFRWTGAEARAVIACSGASQERLTVRVLHPDLQSDPVMIIVRMATAQQVHVANAPGEYHFVVPCRFAGQLPYSISVSRVWIPALQSGSDRRALGVQLF